jgi:hypothetical protein
MGAGTYHFKAEEGITFSVGLTWKDSNGSAIDITGYSATMDIKKQVGGTVVQALTTADSTMDIPTGTDGVLNILLSAAQMSAITPDTYLYDIKLDDGSGVTTRLLEGTFSVKAEITE